MDRVEHSGEVVRVENGTVYVAITVQGACGSCGARKACGMGETERKILEIHTPDATTYRSGDAVTVSVTRHAGLRAVLLAYVVPFLVLVAVVVVCVLSGMGEGAAVLLGLGAVVLCYGVLWLCRRRIEGGIHFTISK